MKKNPHPCTCNSYDDLFPKNKKIETNTRKTKQI